MFYTIVATTEDRAKFTAIRDSINASDKQLFNAFMALAEDNLTYLVAKVEQMQAAKLAERDAAKADKKAVKQIESAEKRAAKQATKQAKQEAKAAAEAGVKKRVSRKTKKVDDTPVVVSDSNATGTDKEGDIIPMVVVGE